MFPIRNLWSNQYFLLVIFLLLCVNFVFSKIFTVLRVSVENEKQLQYLWSQYVNSSKYDFWKEPTGIGQQVHVMIKDKFLDDFIENLTMRNFTYEVMIDDVEKVIKKRTEQAAKRRQQRLYHDAPDSRSRVAFNFGRYHSFADMINYLNGLAITYPDRVHVMPIGTTHEGRQIPLIKVGKRTNAVKPAIWIDGGIHAREWVAPSVVLYFIGQLVTEYEKDPTIKHFVDSMDWYIVPILNPDGYEYSRSSSDPETRLWRKNRSPAICTQVSSGLFAPAQTQCCQGVDLNRNFDWYFGQVGSSTDPCSEIYAGQFAFSEPETRAVRDFLKSQPGRIKTFLTFHSYSQILMYPFGHATRTYPNDVTDLSITANRAAQALQNMYGTKYTVGTGADTLYPASGGSEDWAKGNMGVKYSYLFELRPEDHVWDGFLLAENQIVPTCRETWEAVKVIATQTLQANRISAVPQTQVLPPRFSSFRSGAPPSASSIANNMVFHKNCQDFDQLCPYWAENGACHTWPSMRERCPKSCGFCQK